MMYGLRLATGSCPLQIACRSAHTLKPVYFDAVLRSKLYGSGSGAASLTFMPRWSVVGDVGDKAILRRITGNRYLTFLTSLGRLSNAADFRAGVISKSLGWRCRTQSAAPVSIWCNAS